MQINYLIPCVLRVVVYPLTERALTAANPRMSRMNFASAIAVNTNSSSTSQDYFYIPGLQPKHHCTLAYVPRTFPQRYIHSDHQQLGAAYMAVEVHNPDNSLLLHLRRRSHEGYLVEASGGRCRRSLVAVQGPDCRRPFFVSTTCGG